MLWLSCVDRVGATGRASVNSYFEKSCRKKCAFDNPERRYGIWSIHSSWHCSCQTYFCCFPLALVNIRPWPLVWPAKNVFPVVASLPPLPRRERSDDRKYVCCSQDTSSTTVSNFFEEEWTQNYPNTFRDCRVYFFRQPFSKYSWPG